MCSAICDRALQYGRPAKYRSVDELMAAASTTRRSRWARLRECGTVDERDVLQVRFCEPEDLSGIVPISRANQAASLLKDVARSRVRTTSLLF